MPVKLELPPVRVVSGVDQAYTLRARLRDAARSMQPSVQEALAVAVGLWPLWLLGLFAFGLIWGFALASSP